MNRQFCATAIAWAVVLGVGGPAVPAEAAPSPDEQAKQILEATGIRGGLIVHLGCGDPGAPGLTAALRASEAYVVHGLDSGAAGVAKARDHIQQKGLYGPVSVDRFDGKRLPYVDNLVNLLVAEDLGEVPMEDVRRVLAPGGVACILKKGGRPEVHTKPWPENIDEWTHFLHDASGNAVADDTVIGSPRGIRWWAGPKRSRDHDALASLSAMTSAGGRLFYIFDEGHTSLIHRPARWRLIARDAFNGTLLWKRRIPDWVTTLHYFRSGPAHVTRRLVSVGDRVYVTLGLEAPVTALDAATGETLRTYEGSEKAEEILWHDGVLLAVTGDPAVFNRLAPDVWNYWQRRVEQGPAAPKMIVAYRAETGEVLWRKTGQDLARLAPLSLCACGKRVFYLDDEHLHGLDLASGERLWSAPFAAGGLFLRNYAPTVIARADAVLCLSERALAAFSPQDGKDLWRRDRGSLGFASPADMFVIGGLVWTLPGTAAVRNPSDRKTHGKAYEKDHYLGDGDTFWGMDPATGEVKRSFKKTDVWPGGHHHRCYRNKATSRYLVCSRRGLEFIDLSGDGHVRNWWVRGECQYGVMPANGMVYAPPDPCRCFNFVKVNGLLALSAESSLDAAGEAEVERLETGPAYGAEIANRKSEIANLKSEISDSEPDGAGARPPIRNPKPARRSLGEGGSEIRNGHLWHPPVAGPNPDDWPTFRHDVTRSGAAPTAVPRNPAPLWTRRLGGNLTAPVLADGRLFVADCDGQTLHCLDARTGEPRWRFTAGGRIDSPPTLVGDLAVFGCRDGCVYAVRAADGRLAWRYRVAPADRRLAADGRVESVWPVHGSVLVLDGVAYAAAGRSSYLDGGIWLCGLEAATGRKRCEARLTADAATPGKPEWTGALHDVLVSDGSTITMRQVQFDTDLRQRDPAELATLFTTTGLLEDAWFHRQVWHLGRPGKVGSTGKQAVNSGSHWRSGWAVGQLIVFDADRAYAVQSPYTYLKNTKSMWPPTHQGHLHQKYARYKPEWFPTGVWLVAQENAKPADSQWQRKGNKPLRAGPVQAWKQEIPLQVRAMVLAGDTLFAAGWLDAVGVKPPAGETVPGATNRPAELWVVSPEDGRQVAAFNLDAPPVFDGLIAAGGRLYLAGLDGTVRCLGEAKKQ